MPTKTRVLKCYDKLSDKIVTVGCINSYVPNDVFNGTYFNIQQCRGAAIAEEVQRLSDKFLKINDISFEMTPFNEGDNYIINREYLGTFLDFKKY